MVWSQSPPHHAAPSYLGRVDGTGDCHSMERCLLPHVNRVNGRMIVGYAKRQQGVWKDIKTLGRKERRNGSEPNTATYRLPRGARPVVPRPPQPQSGAGARGNASGPASTRRRHQSTPGPHLGGWGQKVIDRHGGTLRPRLTSQEQQRRRKRRERRRRQRHPKPTEKPFRQTLCRG